MKVDATFAYQKRSQLFYASLCTNPSSVNQNASCVMGPLHLVHLAGRLGTDGATFTPLGQTFAAALQEGVASNRLIWSPAALSCAAAACRKVSRTVNPPMKFYKTTDAPITPLHIRGPDQPINVQGGDFTITIRRSSRHGRTLRRCATCMNICTRFVHCYICKILSNEH